jgi:hypothetical protein
MGNVGMQAPRYFADVTEAARAKEKGVQMAFYLSGRKVEGGGKLWYSV